MRAVELRVAPIIVLSIALTGCDAGRDRRESRREPQQRGKQQKRKEPAARLAVPPALETSLRQGDKGSSIADVAERTLPAVVNISSTRVVRRDQMPPGPFQDPFLRRFFGMPPGPEQRPDRRERGLGSGVLVSQDGLVLTNNHVVARAQDIRVTLSDQREYRARVVGTDPKSDMALLKLSDAPKDLQTISFGDSDRLRLGDVVLAIGNPFGVGQTVTMGIVSAKGRADMGIVDYEDFIQTDAAINPGNSGGPLVNMRGELVGINTAILSRTGGYQGIGFAIPSNMARPIMESLLRRGKVVRGWLGVAIQDLSPDLAAALDAKGKQGVLIASVPAGTPAARAGLRRGDIVLSLDGQRVESGGQLRLLVASRSPGTTVKLGLLRDREELQLSVSLGQVPGSVESARAEEPRAEDSAAGVGLRPLDGALRQKLGVPESIQQGVVVEAIDPRGPLAESGLRAGDVVVEVNRRPVGSPEALRRALAEARSRAVLLVFREGSTLYLLLGEGDRD